jgi:hypothetical protein
VDNGKCQGIGRRQKPTLLPLLPRSFVAVTHACLLKNPRKNPRKNPPFKRKKKSVFVILPSKKNKDKCDTRMTGVERRKANNTINF